MSSPEKQHNSLVATRELMKIMINQEKCPDIPEKIRLSVESLLRDYPDRSVIDELYRGKTFSDMVENSSDTITEEEREINNKIYNNNQTWKTPGFKWKTQVEFIPNK